ncbi:competence type IV pilus major pilin ComGC [Metabacillus niabensis]|uniref:ComG operon protein 3 n=1 Tax=Metabacillus niabensis TaxID=324854 RepID=A0ABT9YZ49_9BACI|nr:competence type IV pilus major pilin ComGC [Metabacillus niabensis]MDQ0224887.1 competence protein ComGC [Metabacillus niabensis]PAD69414.1 competence protein ComG [Bacillus sp. 7586-K]
MKDQKGFTLIEMLVVLLVITILLLITIPNVTKHNSRIQKKGCEGLVNMVQAQVTAYKIDNNKTPKMDDLLNAGYLKGEQAPVCPNGNSIIIGADGEVTASGEGQ